MEVDLEIELKSGREELIRITQFTLVGKLLTSRLLNKKGVIGVLKNVWTAKEVVEIREISGNLYAIKGLEYSGFMGQQILVKDKKYGSLYVRGAEILIVHECVVETSMIYSGADGQS